ncbi:MAG: hypothetical protein H0T90_01800, partial [Gemmatimonadales bacterium]|nr:hypothetical protein [Gemmatimonadales bacterium]
MPVLWMSAVVLSGCQDDYHSPPARPEAPAGGDASEADMLAPLDLIYVCGNKFLATNSTPSPVQVSYRLVGSGEIGRLDLPGPDEHPGHSETELETVERGVVELYLGDDRVARRRNEGRPCGAAAISASFAATTQTASGEWSDPFPWPVVALHLSLLPNGKVLSWGHSGAPQVWNPATGNFSAAPSPAWLFCAGHSLLADGRVLVTGGHMTNGHGLPDINIFTPSTESWSRSTPMRRGRWYPTNTTMGNGEVVILAGKDEAGSVVDEPEVWSTGGVRMLTTASRTLAYYPRAFLAPNGQLFYAGHAVNS